MNWYILSGEIVTNQLRQNVLQQDATIISCAQAKDNWHHYVSYMIIMWPTQIELADGALSVQEDYISINRMRAFSSGCLI